jgi:hypothetical protein
MLGVPRSWNIGDRTLCLGRTLDNRFLMTVGRDRMSSTSTMILVFHRSSQPNFIFLIWLLTKLDLECCKSLVASQFFHYIRIQKQKVSRMKIAIIFGQPLGSSENFECPIGSKKLSFRIADV